MFKSAAFCLFFICQSSGFNISRLMTIYIEACGERDMCFDWPGITNYEPHLILSRCQPCSCEESCFQELNCCPDKFFQRSLAILDTPHIHIEKISKLTIKPQYEIITTCPKFSTEEESQKCENASDDFDFNIPVSSLVSNHSYRNVFCAYCHGEKELNLVTWGISLDHYGVILNFINFIESYQQLQFLSKAHRTNVVYSPPTSMEEIIHPKFLNPERYRIQSCPDDKDLDTACSSSYVNQFRLYRNIFCYLCKLKELKRPGPIIGSCSSQNNKTVQKCQQSSISAMTYPYKNFYCFQCNTPLRNLDGFGSRRCYGSECKEFLRYHFSDFSTIARELYTSDKKEQFLKFFNTTFSSDTILKTIRDSNRNDIHFPFKNMENNNSVSFGQLLDTIVAINPRRLCRQDLLSESVRNLTTERQCDCSYSCLFLGRCNCCIDTALLHPVECIDRVSPFSKTQRGGSILVVSRCYENNMNQKSTNEYKRIKGLCEENSNNYDILILSKNITYRNIFCFLCNTNYTIKDHNLFHNPYNVVDFNIICKSQFNFVYAMNFDQLLQQAKTQKCRVLYDASKLVLCDLKTSISRWNCPRVEKARVVKWMCENPSPHSFMPIGRFKNEFCQMCNSNKNGDIKTCNHSNILDVRFKNACLTLPDVGNHPFVHPFRNQFCSHCGENKALRKNTTHSRTHCKPMYGSDKVYQLPLMRELFIPKRHINEKLLERKVETMDNICYPGKILVGEKCVPVIHHPKGITYALFILCQLKVTAGSNDTSKIFNLVGNSVEKYLHQNFSIASAIYFNGFNFLPKLPIVTAFRGGHFHYTLQVNLFFRLSYIKHFERDKVEKYLLALPSKLYVKVTSQGDEHISIDLKGVRFSNISKALKSQENVLPDAYASLVAVIYNFLGSSYPSNFVYVSDLLFCRQRMVGGSEVKINFLNGHITVKKTKENFYIGEFVLDFENNYHVCVHSNQPYKKAFYNGYVDKLETLTTVLNIISIISLLFLFVLYILVPELRTLPGLNIMNTTFSLFCMQITYTVANVLRRSTLLCQITGVILHYFWLTLCCCLFICSLHMFRTFSSYRQDAINGQNIKAMFTFYVFFCYFIPFVIVGANIISTFAFQGNIGYGKYLCFVENLIQNIATFVVPLSVTCTVNSVLFILTLLNIKFAQNIRKSKENKSELLISIKLFSLTGTVWILQVLDSFSQISVFSFVVTFLTSLQGLFIFLSFSSSSRILNYIKSLLWKRNIHRIGDEESKYTASGGSSCTKGVISNQQGSSSATILP